MNFRRILLLACDNDSHQQMAVSQNSKPFLKRKKCHKNTVTQQPLSFSAASACLPRGHLYHIRWLVLVLPEEAPPQRRKNKLSGLPTGQVSQEGEEKRKFFGSFLEYQDTTPSRPFLLLLPLLFFLGMDGT